MTTNDKKLADEIRALADIQELTTLNPDPVQDLDRLLEFDPLHTMEKLTGKSYKEPGQELAGLAFHVTHTKKRQQELERRGDTSHVTDFQTHLDLALGLGFEVVFTMEFDSNYKVDGTDTPYRERYLLLFDPKRGALMTLESFMGTRRNGSTMYFNWQATEEYKAATGKYWPPVRGSGGFDPVDPTIGRFDALEDPSVELVYNGSLDMREAMLHNIEKLDKAGRWVTPWAHQPFLWLLTYMEKNRRDENRDYFKDINAERIAQLPAHVQEAIKGR